MIDDFKLKTPVLLIIYCRLGTTQKVFERIKNAKPLKLYIAADGPKENAPKDQMARIFETREWVLKNIDWECEVYTNFSETNLGCKVRPYTAVTWVLEHEETVIVLEDDIVVENTFFRYCQEMLEQYKDCEDVMTVSGYKAEEDFQIEGDYFFSYFSPIWGWATWKRAWKKYDPDMKKWPLVKKQKLLKKLFGKDAAYCIERDFDRAYGGNIDAWDYQWLFARIANRGLGIVPKYNLITNIGFENELATHTNGMRMEFHPRPLEFPLEIGNTINRNIEYDKEYERTHYKCHIIKDSIKKIVPRFLLEKWRVMRSRYLQ